MRSMRDGTTFAGRVARGRSEVPGKALPHHSGIVTSQQLEFGEMLRRVVRFVETVAAAEMRDMIRNLAEFK